jgi:hypothetical protein
MKMNYRFLSKDTLVSVSKERLKEIAKKQFSTLEIREKAILSNELGEMYNSLSVFKTINPEIEELANESMLYKFKLAESDITPQERTSQKRARVQAGEFSGYELPWMKKEVN